MAEHTTEDHQRLPRTTPSKLFPDSTHRNHGTLNVYSFKELSFSNSAAQQQLILIHAVSVAVANPSTQGLHHFSVLPATWGFLIPVSKFRILFFIANKWETVSYCGFIFYFIMRDFSFNLHFNDVLHKDSFSSLSGLRAKVSQFLPGSLQSDYFPNLYFPLASSSRILNESLLYR